MTEAFVEEDTAQSAIDSAIRVLVLATANEESAEVVCPVIWYECLESIYASMSREIAQECLQEQTELEVCETAEAVE